MRGEQIAPLPFLLSRLLKCLAAAQRIFFPNRAVRNLEIHKVFLRFQTFACGNISRCSFDNPFLRACMVSEPFVFLVLCFRRMG